MPFGRLGAAKPHEVTTLQQDVTTFKITFDRFIDKNTKIQLSNGSDEVFLDELPDFVDPLTSSGDEWDSSKMRKTSNVQDADDTIDTCTSQKTGAHDAFLGQDVTVDSWDIPIPPPPLIQEEIGLKRQLYNQLFNALQSHEPGLRQMFPLVSKYEQRLPQKLTNMLLDLGTVNLHHILSGDLRNVYTALHTLHGYYSRLEEESRSQSADINTRQQTTAELKDRSRLQIRVENLKQELKCVEQHRLDMQRHCYVLKQENARLRKNAASSTAAAKQRHASEVAKLKAAMKHIAAQATSLERRVRFMKKAKC